MSEASSCTAVHMQQTSVSSTIYTTHPPNLVVYLSCKNVPPLPLPVNATAVLRQYCCLFFQPLHHPSIHLRAPTGDSRCLLVTPQYFYVNKAVGSDEVRNQTPHYRLYTIYCIYTLIVAPDDTSGPYQKHYDIHHLSCTYIRSQTSLSEVSCQELTC